MRAERCELAALGRRLRATRLPQPIERWLRRAWGSAPQASLPTDCELDLSWRARARWEAVPSLARSRTEMRAGVALEWVRHADRWWSTTFGLAGLELTLHANHARIELWGERWGDAPALTGARAAMLVALQAAITEGLRSRGLVPLHAAVAVRDGEATALFGDHDADRSSALLNAVREGWLPLAQDLAWLEPESRRVYAWRGERGIRIARDAVAQLSDAWRSAITRPSHDDVVLLPFDALAEVRPEVARLTRVVLLQHGEVLGSTAEGVSPREAAVALWRCVGTPLCRVSQRALAEQLPTLLRALEWRRSVGIGEPMPR